VNGVKQALSDAKLTCFLVYFLNLTDYTVSNRRVNMNDGLKPMWKEATVAYFQVYPSILVDRLKETNKSQDRWPTGQEFNPGVLNTQQ
jgi:hypothetical protein